VSRVRLVSDVLFLTHQSVDSDTHPVVLVSGQGLSSPQFRFAAFRTRQNPRRLEQRVCRLFAHRILVAKA
jgi:hypothetical protein